MQAMYFSWLRERVGTGSEMIDPGRATTVAELIRELSAREDRYAAAFQDISAVRVAVDQQMVDMDHPLDGAREIGFFPPMTGG
ncbi:MAG: molybdopterin converting factor subunit 1 [Pseudomonadota bacterium]